MTRNISGLSAIKTGQKAKIRSMPGKSGNSYLSLYVMSKEKERLEQERLTVEKRKGNLEADLKDLNKVIEKMKKAAPMEDAEAQRGGQRMCAAMGGRLKTLIMDY